MLKRQKVKVEVKDVSLPQPKLNLSLNLNLNLNVRLNLKRMLSLPVLTFIEKPVDLINRKFVEQRKDSHETGTDIIDRCRSLPAMQLFPIIKNKNCKNGYRE